MTGIARALKGKHFERPDEADAYINALLDEGGVEEAAQPTTPLEEAQDLMYIAWETRDADERIALAEEALDISADCADAFTLLGNEKAASPAEARAYYEEGVRAGLRALGERALEEGSGAFWWTLETRPYMRARFELAICLWMLGEAKEAVEHLRGLLRLNPEDPLDCRSLLLLVLIQEEDHSAVEELFASYPDDRSTEWLYEKALWLIGRHAPASEILAALNAAMDANDQVPAYLVGKKSVPQKISKIPVAGSDAEAGAYAGMSKERWVATVGALEQLRQAVGRRKKSVNTTLQ
jgi:tetratricopeptide (TPR) repeat protein